MLRCLGTFLNLRFKSVGLRFSFFLNPIFMRSHTKNSFIDPPCSLLPPCFNVPPSHHCCLSLPHPAAVHSCVYYQQSCGQFFFNFVLFFSVPSIETFTPCVANLKFQLHSHTVILQVNLPIPICDWESTIHDGVCICCWSPNPLLTKYHTGRLDLFGNFVCKRARN